MNTVQQAARRLERLEALGKVARPLAGAVGRAVRPRGAQPAQRHRPGASPAPDADRPADRSVGDVGLAGRAGGPAAEEAADLLVTAGVVAAVPTAAAALNE